jgi:hypothetical protein
MDIMALGLLSRRESRKDLWPRLILGHYGSGIAFSQGVEKGSLGEVET